MAQQELSAGDLLNRTVDLLKANVSHTGGYIVGLAVLGTILDVLGIGTNMVYTITSSVAAYFLSRSMLAGAGLGLPPGNRFGAYFGMSILIGLGALLGLILLIVPGIILFVRWLPSLGILIAEDAGVIESMRRSWHRTASSFWPLFIVALIYWATVVVAIGGMALMAGDTDSLALGIAIPFNLAISAAGAFSVGLGIAAYLMLGPQAKGDLGEVFA